MCAATQVWKEKCSPLDAPARLAKALAGQGSGAKEAVSGLYAALCGQRTIPAEESFAAWCGIFAKIGGPDLEGRREKLKKLSVLYGLDAVRFRPAELLFALHTYYALIVKLVARRAGSVSDRSSAGELDPFDWVFEAPPWNRHVGNVSHVVEQVAIRLNACELFSASPDSPEGIDLFQPLYEALLPKQIRHALGEYYTPPWLAEHVLDRLGYAGDPRKRLLDPACGSGVFLLAAIRRIRAWHARHGAEYSMSEDELARLVQANVVGCDLNPLAVLAARVNYRLALGDSDDTTHPEVPVHQCDSILSPPPLDTFDYVAGNPPWVAWDNLPPEYRAATKPLWEHYGLFSLNGKAARHGGGKKDLSMLMLYAAADRYLATGGRLGFVITQTLLQTSGAGDGFRRFRLGNEGEWLGVTHVDDFVATRPFDAANWTSVLVLERGKRTEYPVPYVRWSADSRQEVCSARPIDASHLNSPWLIEPLCRVHESAYETGLSDYTAHLGANTGGANGIFWLRILGRHGDLVLIENLPECGKKPVPRVRQLVEHDLLYPLARWGDVARNCITPSAYLLLAQDPARRTGIEVDRMRRDYPLTYAYLKQFEPQLVARAAYKRYQGHAPFYSMYDVAEYTLAPHKVVWRRMDKQITAAVAGEINDRYLGHRPIVPQETCVLIACDSADEAEYLCHLLNSEEVNRLAQSHGVRGGKGFGSPAMLAHLNLRRFNSGDARQ